MALAVMEYHVVFLNSTYLHEAKKSQPIKSTQGTLLLPVRACNFPWPSRIHPSISSYALVPFLPCFVLSFFFTSYFLLPFPSTSRVFYSTTQPVPSCSSIIDPQSLFSRLIRFVDKTPLPSSLPHSFSSCFSQET